MKRFSLLPLLVLTLACETPAARARSDSARALAAEQERLMAQLTAQRDSLSHVVVEADAFVGQIDSAISKVKGLKKPPKPAQTPEGPLQEQMQARKDMLAKVNALVERARTTAAQLAESQRREKELRGENAKLQARIDSVQTILAELNASIEQQAVTIAALTARTDSLDTVLNDVRAAQSKAYYIIGREDELLKKGVIVREGGANMLVARVGRTIVPARSLDRQLFTPIDVRNVQEITMPDTSRRYQIVSRQSLDNAVVAMREQSTFRGNLRINDIDQFWAPSKFLIIVQR